MLKRAWRQEVRLDVIKFTQVTDYELLASESSVENEELSRECWQTLGSRNGGKG